MVKDGRASIVAVVALLLVMFMAFSLGITVDRGATILEQAYEQVVVVTCGSSYGTGWFVNDNTIVTAYHVVAQCDTMGLTPRLVRGSWTSTASIVAADRDHDIAALRVASPPPWAEGLPLSYEVSIGDEVFVVGYPIQLYLETGDINTMSETPRIARGIVSWIHPTQPIFQFDAETDQGNSGGPVVSEKTGGVVGIVIYARPGVVSEGYFGLRMDQMALFLQENGIPFQVADGRSIAPFLGLAFLALLLIGAAYMYSARTRR